MTVQLCVCGFLLSTALIVNAAERITIAVSPVQSIAPTNLRVRVHVTPDADNRGLELSADSGGYFRSSWIQAGREGGSPNDDAGAPRSSRGILCDSRGPV